MLIQWCFWSFNFDIYFGDMSSAVMIMMMPMPVVVVVVVMMRVSVVMVFMLF
jgi:hypothetical protein